ncbi:MAG TPA: energy-coupling factor transporter ATPase [Firmicutes bacterium]|nr:energy-coupling factor transporter ATPase [Bacillota bacterium]HAW99908.1 energy-coupling factor transporter ATPase [Bacillota bacterium]
MSNKSAVRLEHLSYSYKNDDNINEEDLTINDVNFDIYEGEYVALIGHNGSGKSTLAKLIIGLYVQLKGQIYIFDQEMNDDNVYELRKNLGIIFQNPDNQFIGSTVRDDIAFGLENDCIDTDTMKVLVDEFAEKVGMKEYLDKEPSNLSGGQKQRVAIAGALARKPKILIMDEATAMLDPKGRRDIRNLIKKMKDENPGLTIISITHDIDEAYQADKVIVLNKGKVFLSGTPEEVFEQSDKLLSIKLDIPFFHKLNKELKKEGINIDGVGTLEGLVQKLCR